LSEDGELEKPQNAN